MDKIHIASVMKLKSVIIFIMSLRIYYKLEKKITNLINKSLRQTFYTIILEKNNFRDK